MRGYFGIGIDGANKPGNVGNLVRTAHAFGASFAFVVHPALRDRKHEAGLNDFADTAKSADALPFYIYDGPDQIERPSGCRFVGVELDDRAVALPVFRHPTRAVYVLGSERFGLSPAMKEACDDVVCIPTQFSLNVATAGAVVMYDRVRVLGGFGDRPIMPGAKPEARPDHVHGGPVQRKLRKKAVKQE